MRQAAKIEQRLEAGRIWVLLRRCWCIDRCSCVESAFQHGASIRHDSRLGRFGVEIANTIVGFAGQKCHARHHAKLATAALPGAADKFHRLV
jgi:hypothetical protein